MECGMRNTLFFLLPSSRPPCELSSRASQNPTVAMRPTFQMWPPAV
jgi:hypothetical protein